jgi:L-amino acid N-acyltransferase
MRFVACTYEEHASGILAIFNDAIVNSTALYDYTPRAPESMVGWFKTKETGRYPVIGAVDEQGRLLGFASYGSFRAWPAYKYSVEHSVYVGGIDVANAGSIAMHEKLGFAHAGTIRQAGFKFGRWLDLGFWQLLLKTPANPHDG